MTRMQPKLLLVSLFQLCFRRSIAELIRFDEPVHSHIPLSFYPYEKHTLQVHAPGVVDMSNLTFLSDEQDIMVHVVFLRTKVNSENLDMYSIEGEDNDDILDPDYCQNNSTQQRWPVMDPTLLHQYGGFNVSVRAGLNETKARYPDPDVWSRQTLTKSGDYVVILTACVPDQQFYGVHVQGVVRVRYSYGYLPRGILKLAVLQVAICAFSLTMACLYGYRLCGSTTTTLTERITLAALTTMTLKATDMVMAYFVWNTTGEPAPESFFFVELLFEFVKHALMYALAVMMSLGQGYSRWVIALGSWYIVLSLVIAGFSRFVFESQREFRQQWLPVYHAIFTMYTWTDILAILLILCCLRRTIGYLKLANQHDKLRRFRFLLVLLLLLLVVWVGVMFDRQQRRRSSAVHFVSELTDVTVLTAMAFLWWPSPENQVYERVLQLPMLDEYGNPVAARDGDIDESNEYGNQDGTSSTMIDDDVYDGVELT